MSFYYSFIAGPTVRSKAVEMEVITSVVTDKDTGIRVDIYVARALGYISFVCRESHKEREGFHA